MNVDVLAPVLNFSSINLVRVAARLLPTGGTGQVTDRLDDKLSSWLAAQTGQKVRVREPGTAYFSSEELS